jgi:tetratricopeptide (TPR) repeat protein
MSMSGVEETAPAPALAARRRPARRLSLIAFGALLLMLVVLAGAGYAGYQAGLSQRVVQEQATQTADLAHQYELGVADLQAGRFEVAAVRFEYILQLDPHYRDANQKLVEARHGLEATATPTVSPSPTSQPTATETHEAADIFKQAQAEYAAQDWDAVISTLSHLHAVDPNYEAVKANGMLYVALRSRGIARILGDEMETGMYDLDQAEAIGPLDAEALNYRAWARLYLAARSYWGLDWRESMQILQQLYVLAPYFRDTSVRLYQATVNSADQLARTGDFCAAAVHYTEAQALSPDTQVADKLAAATAACSQTPTPGASGSATPNLTPTVTITPTP